MRTDPDIPDARECRLAKLVNIFNRQATEAQHPEFAFKSTKQLDELIDKGVFGDPKQFQTVEGLDRLHPDAILAHQMRQLTEVRPGHDVFYVHSQRIRDVEPGFRPARDAYFTHWLCDDRVQGTTVIVDLLPNVKDLEPKEQPIDQMVTDFVSLALKDPSEPGRGKRFYPLDGDRGKIIAFVEKYGHDSIAYPNPNTEHFPPESWTYFEEFYRQYEDFMYCYNRVITGRPLVDIHHGEFELSSDGGAVDIHPSAHEDHKVLLTLNSQLRKIRYEMVFKPSRWKRTSKVGDRIRVYRRPGMNIRVPIVESKILYCYDWLGRVLESRQSGKQCPQCRTYFLAHRKDRVYCGRKCQNLANVRKFRAR